MSLLPPKAKHVGQVWVDPITAERFEWDGEDWRGLGPNPDWYVAGQTKPASVDDVLPPSQEGAA